MPKYNLQFIRLKVYKLKIFLYCKDKSNIRNVWHIFLHNIILYSRFMNISTKYKSITTILIYKINILNDVVIYLK